MTSTTAVNRVSISETPQFFSPKRKRLSLEPSHPVTTCLDESACTDTAMMSFSTASSLSLSSRLPHDGKALALSSFDNKGILSLSATSIATDIAAHDGGDEQETPYTVNTVRFFSPPLSSTLPMRAIINEETVVKHPFRPSALFPSSGSDSIRKPRSSAPIHSPLKRHERPHGGELESEFHHPQNSQHHLNVHEVHSIVRGHIFDNIDKDVSVSQQRYFTRSTRGGAERNWPKGDGAAAASHEQDQSNDDIDRLLSESDTSMDTSFSPQQTVGSQSIRTAPRGGRVETAPLFDQSLFEYPAMSPVMTSSHLATATHTVQRTATRRFSNNNDDNDEHNHHKWLTENVSNFSRSCDLNNQLDRGEPIDKFLTNAMNEEDNLGREVMSSPVKVMRHSTHHNLPQSLSHSLFPTSPAPTLLDDFGTPVTERGSPAVLLEGLHYEEEDSDRERDMEISINSSCCSLSRSIFKDDDDDCDGGVLEDAVGIGSKPVLESHNSSRNDLTDDVEPAVKVRRKSQTVFASSPVRETHDHSFSSPSGAGLLTAHGSRSVNRLFRTNSNNSVVSATGSQGSVFSTMNDNDSDKQQQSSSSSFSQSSLRPLPDPAAFDTAVSTRLNNSFEHQNSSVVCPATPSRSGWNMSSMFDSSGASFGDVDMMDSSSSSNMMDSDIMDTFPRPPAIMRLNSLHENKLLLTQSEDGSPRGDVAFYRDFVVQGIIGQGTFAEVYKVRAINLSARRRPESTFSPDRKKAIAMTSGFAEASSSSKSTSSSSSSLPPMNKFAVSQPQDDTEYFAVKKIKRQFRSRKDREWLLNEVRIMKQVNRHPCVYIIPFVRAWQEDNHFFVQLGLAEKGTLKDLAHQFAARKEVIPTNTLWHVIHDVSAGLAHIHECGIVHLDIKPANILINNEGRLQIGDFGMASEIGSMDDSHEGDTRYLFSLSIVVLFNLANGLIVV
jgi:tRNA A-37 threonylcarbamoyl transferase component Bud32